MPRLWPLPGANGEEAEPCEHQPQPSSSVQPHTLCARTHVLIHLRRHDLRQVLCVCGHSRQVVVHSSAGEHILVEEHQPQPGARSAHEHTSCATEQADARLTLSVVTLSARPARSKAPDTIMVPIAKSHGALRLCTLWAVPFERGLRSTERTLQLW